MKRKPKKTKISTNEPPDAFYISLIKKGIAAGKVAIGDSLREILSPYFKSKPKRKTKLKTKRKTK